MTKFKSQGLHIIRIKYWYASGSGSPPSLIPALWNIGILLHKQAKLQTIMHTTVCMIMVRKSRKQFFQKKETFWTTGTQVIFFIYRSFFGRIKDTMICFRDFRPLTLMLRIWVYAMLYVGPIFLSTPKLKTFVRQMWKEGGRPGYSTRDTERNCND